MTDSTHTNWRRELGAISRGMMFLDGSFTAPPEGDRLPQSPQPRAAGTGQRHPLSHGLVRLFEDLLLLGGRPAHARHNDDIDEPFPPLHRRSQALARRMQRRQQVRCAAC